MSLFHLFRRFASMLSVLLKLAAILPALALAAPPRFRVLVLAEHGGVHQPFVDAARIWLAKEAVTDDLPSTSSRTPTVSLTTSSPGTSS